MALNIIKKKAQAYSHEYSPQSPSAALLQTTYNRFSGRGLFSWLAAVHIIIRNYRFSALEEVTIIVFYKIFSILDSSL